MLLNLALILIGIGLLVYSADRFTAGAAAIATHLNVPKIVIGLTIVAIGSSAPEMFVSATAAINDAPGIAIGNALGSNIINIAVVLGLTTVLMPLAIDSKIVTRELPLLVVVTLACGGLMLDGHLGRLEGILMLAALAAYIAWLTMVALKQRKNDKLLEELIEELPSQMPLWQAILWTLVGLVLLMLSSDMLVTGAAALARAAGISELVIGLTVIAIGTSLPELAASLAAAAKREHEMVLGNIIGSNIFNLLGVIGLSAALSPQHLEPLALTRDLPSMVIITLLLYAMSHTTNRKSELFRWHGYLLLSMYGAYTLWLFHTYQ
ncbi:MAG: calcium/sodium antiporter [Gammaproteobacteria bacterium]|nr:MAG: calcium/sodium antiporter [Gammaproteobacteria bacterium]